MRKAALGLLVALGLAGCTSAAKVYRTQGPDQPECARSLDLGPANLEPVRQSDNPARCHLQAHVLPVADADGGQNWTDLAAVAGRPILEPGGFTLGFVEIADGGYLHRPEQLATLAAHLDARRAEGRQNYVVAFVHGWRHDAALRDGDVRKFRILLGYARAALNARCVARAEYCDAALTGVFVGWRGRSFAEPVLATDGRLSPFALLAAPTLFDRKDRSDRLAAGDASPLAQVLDTVQARLRLAPGRAGADKFLIVGHSLGGNMLATLMQDRALAAIRRHRPGKNGQGPALPPPMGDLVVLLNPAAEARKWTVLQDALRDKAGLARADNQLSAQGPDGQVDWRLWSRLTPWRQMFPMTQRPVYVAITATDNWAGSELAGRKVDYDADTGQLFPLAQRLRGRTDPEDRRAIGHLAPAYLDQRTLSGPAIGTSHEFSVNQGTGQRASYRLAAEPAASWCDPANGWLRAVREDQKALGWTFGDAWDYGLSPSQAEGRLRAAENIARGINSASVQWRHSLNLRGLPNAWSVAPGRSPFWNVRALDTAVREHAGYVNYPLWCALNQLVLDDVTSARSPDPTVQAIRAAQDDLPAAD